MVTGIYQVLHTAGLHPTHLAAVANVIGSPVPPLPQAASPPPAQLGATAENLPVGRCPPTALPHNQGITGAQEAHPGPGGLVVAPPVQPHPPLVHPAPG